MPAWSSVIVRHSFLLGGKFAGKQGSVLFHHARRCACASPAPMRWYVSALLSAVSLMRASCLLALTAPVLLISQSATVCCATFNSPVIRSCVKPSARQAAAMQTYLRGKELQRPMLGAQRRCEARMGQLIGTPSAQVKRRCGFQRRPLRSWLTLAWKGRERLLGFPEKFPEETALFHGLLGK